MLAGIMLLNEELVHLGAEARNIARLELVPGAEAHGDVSHLGHGLQHYGVVHRVVGVRAPGEGAVVAHQHGEGMLSWK